MSKRQRLEDYQKSNQNTARTPSSINADLQSYIRRKMIQAEFESKRQELLQSISKTDTSEANNLKTQECNHDQKPQGKLINLGESKKEYGTEQIKQIEQQEESRHRYNEARHNLNSSSTNPLRLNNGQTSQTYREEGDSRVGIQSRIQRQIDRTHNLEIERTQELQRIQATSRRVSYYRCSQCLQAQCTCRNRQATSRRVSQQDQTHYYRCPQCLQQPCICRNRQSNSQRESYQDRLHLCRCPPYSRERCNCQNRRDYNQ